MNENEISQEEAIGKSRFESLSDAIFAFAMTLLVISLAVPTIPQADAPELLPTVISGMFYEFLFFTIAFFILAGFWLAHHRIFRYIEFVNNRLIWINFLLLFFVVLIPFTTSISGDYDTVFAAVVLFHINLLCVSIIVAGMRQYIIKDYHELTMEEGREKKLKRLKSRGMSRALVVPVVTILAIFVSFIDPAKSLWCYLLIPIIMLGIRLMKSEQSILH